MSSIVRRAVSTTVALGLACAPLSPAAAADAAGPVGGTRLGETGPIADASDGPLPSVTAASWVVADVESGEVLAAFAPHQRLRPASTIKTLLALTMAPRLDPNGSWCATAADAEVDGSKVGLVPGQTYRIDDLWYGLFLRSGNDVADAIAKAGADGDPARAVRMMQAEAKRLDALDTTVENASGLDADGQYSSAYDLALWGRAALGRGDLRRYFGTLRHDFPGNQTATGTAETSKPFAMYTQNQLINRYPGALGVKDGWTTLARNTMIAAAERDGHIILVTLMGVPAGVTDQAKTLLDWGFAHVQAPPVGALVDPTSTAVVSDDDPALPTTPATEPIVAAPVAVSSHSDAAFAVVSAGVSGGALLLFFVGVGVGNARRRLGVKP
ncbi:MAG TPA: D-alanyl-D-alanine carboxypeptidase [Sporichthyaceae bacterium]|jgi:D-alanyl-D-alanine carboxypeptidase (penicillin-binding protein 5/6)